MIKRQVGVNEGKTYEQNDREVGTIHTHVTHKDKHEKITESIVNVSQKVNRIACHGNT